MINRYKESNEPQIYLCFQFVNGKMLKGEMNLEETLNSMDFPFEIHSVTNMTHGEGNETEVMDIVLRVAKDDYLKFRKRLPNE